MLFDFVYRSANHAAHCIAKVTGSLSGPMEWYDNNPDFLVHVIAAETIEV